MSTSSFSCAAAAHTSVTTCTAWLCECSVGKAESAQQHLDVLAGLCRRCHTIAAASRCARRAAWSDVSAAVPLSVQGTKCNVLVLQEGQPVQCRSILRVGKQGLGRQHCELAERNSTPPRREIQKEMVSRPSRRRAVSVVTAAAGCCTAATGCCTASAGRLYFSCWVL